MDQIQQIGLVVYIVIIVLLGCLFYRLKLQRANTPPSPLPPPSPPEFPSQLSPLTQAEAVVVTTIVPLVHAEMV